MKKIIRPVIYGVVILLLMLNIIFMQKKMPALKASSTEVYDNLRLFTEVLSYVKDNYVEEVDVQKLIRGAMKGMLSTLDPFTQYMPPRAYKEMKVHTSGEYGGLGIVVSIRDNILTVISPIENTPAWDAGIKAGDKIIKINGESTKDITLMEAVNKMRGKPGTDITITIFREPRETKDIKITRQIIKIKGVVYEMKTKDIGYIKLREFTEASGENIRAGLAALKKEGAKKIILDLRNDPGGLLNQAVDVASEFLPKGYLVVYTKGRAPGQNMRFEVEKSGPYLTEPMAVLINGGSASGSEIVTGALQDWSRAIIIGDTSYGKGSVQSVVPLSDGSGLRLTTAHYFTPSGRLIHERGILPDIQVSLNAAGRTKVLEKVSEYANIKTENSSDTQERKVDDMDNQLQMAINILQAYEYYNGKVELKLRHPKEAPFKNKKHGTEDE